MKKAISMPAAIAIIVIVVAVAAVFMWKTASPTPPGPDPQEAAKHMGVDSIREAMAKGPPPGPPEPGTVNGRRPHP